MTDHVLEKGFAQVLLYQVALRASQSLDTFSNWLLAGFAAALSLIISNLSSLPLPTDSVRWIVFFFLVSVVTAVAAKYAGTIVRSSTETGLEMLRQADSLLGTNEFDVSVVLSEVERSIFWPLRWFARRSFAKVQAGDSVRGARSMYQLTQIQGYLVFGQVASVAAAVIALYSGLAG